MSDELYKRLRPNEFEDMYGQDDIIESLEALIDSDSVPHCILATGPSGTGKTTTFRILKSELECSDLDFKEINAADFRGIDMVRDIRNHMMLAPIGGKCKIWLIDECHQLTAQAQESLLKMLEDTPPHVYFMLASTNPEKIKKTIITRSTHYKFKPLTNKELGNLLITVCKGEGKNYSKDFIKHIIDISDGSARKALVLLNQVIHLDAPEEELKETLQPEEVQKFAIDLCRALLNRSPWSKVANIIKTTKEEPETIRWAVLGYMKTVALSGDKPRAIHIIEQFEDNWYDSKLAGLVRASYNALQ